MSELRDYQTKIFNEEYIEIFERAELTKVETILLLESSKLQQKTGLSLDVIQRIQRDLQKYFSAIPLNASVLYDRIKHQNDKDNALKTNCSCLDDLLGGHGLPLGEIVELVGPTSSGKTQISMFVSMHVARSYNQHNIIYVDSSSSFSSDRISEMFKNHLLLNNIHIDKDQDIFSVLDRIKRFNCLDPIKLVEILETMYNELESKNDTFYHNVKLIVIDSIGTLLYTSFGGKLTIGHFIMMKISRLLKSLATKYHISVLITNNTVKVENEHQQQSNNNNIQAQKASLGESWAAVPNHQLFLYSEFFGDDTIERTIALRSSTRFQRSAKRFSINSLGIK